MSAENPKKFTKENAKEIGARGGIASAARKLLEQEARTAEAQARFSVPLEQFGPELMHEAMVHVLLRSEYEDDTFPKKHCRGWLLDDRKSFMAKMSDLALAIGKRDDGEPGRDEGSENVERLIEELRERMKNGT